MLVAHLNEHNYYCQFKHKLELDFTCELAAPFYGRCGQQSIDTVVCFKLCAVGYRESDCKLIEYCSLCLHLLYFLDYQFDEPLPWHSTLSHTRQLLPTVPFEEVFNRVLAVCLEAGMVSGHTQACFVFNSKKQKNLLSLGDIWCISLKTEGSTFSTRH